MIKIAAVVLFFTTVAASCEKEKTPTLPPETQTGAHTFGCYVNGELFLPQWGAAGFGHPSLEADYYQASNFLIIHAAGANASCRIGVSNPEENIKKTPTGIRFTYEKTRYRGENTGMLFFTRFDVVNRIVSGTFACEVPFDEFFGDGVEESTIRVTQGRFDIKLRDHNIRE